MARKKLIYSLKKAHVLLEYSFIDDTIPRTFFTCTHKFLISVVPSCE